MPDLKIKLSTGRSRTSPKWTNKEGTFDALYKQLLKVKRTDETAEQYAAMPKPKRDEIKDKGGFVAGALRDGVRKAQNVICRSMWTADLDYIPPDDVDTFLASIPHKSIVYSTHSHTLFHPRLRLLVPFSHDIPADRYPAVARLLADSTGHIDYFDEVSFRASQLMYWPTCPSDGEGAYICRILNEAKEFLDPDKVLEAHPNWRDFTKLPRTSRETEIKNLDGAAKQEDPFLKTGIVGAVCRTYDIPRAIETFLSDVYEPAGVDNRYTYKAGESTAGLVVYDQGRYAYSYHATDPACGHLCNSYDLIMIHKWGEGNNKKMDAFALEDEAVREALNEERVQKARAEFSAADEEIALPVILKPKDYSDVGQAELLKREHGEKIKFSTATNFIVYNGSFWEESLPKAQGIAKQLTDGQLKEVDEELEKAEKEMRKDGTMKLLADNSVRTAQALMTKEQLQRFRLYQGLSEYKSFIVKRRDFKYLSSTLSTLEHMVIVDTKDLDANPYYLNTPSHTINLQTGKRLDHDPTHLITKQTAVDPDDEGMEIWLSALETFFPKNKALQDYIQEVVGLSAIGKVFDEALIIAYGDGRNGKSTLWNTIAKVFGTYAGSLSSDTLVAFKNRNIQPEIAELRGKRLVIAAELEEGMQLSTAMIKKLCSTDKITAEKKYKDPFDFIPTHTLILYTNHLPRVRALDAGTWRRLIVVPFLAKIEGDSDIKNYSDYLFENCAGAILTWIIEGAVKVTTNQFHLHTPKAVEEASEQYRNNNDWLTPFLEEYCDVGAAFTEKSGKVYKAYHEYCEDTKERPHSTTEFYSALEHAGFERYRTGTANRVRGLRLKSEFDIDSKGEGE